MAEPFLGEIRLVGFTFAPRGWLACQGQLLSISQNSALFSLLGTTYGGDGINTFALPDLRGRAAVGQGQGPGLSPVVIGQIGGTASATIDVVNLPPHTHQATFAPGGGSTPLAVSLAVANTPAGLSSPDGALLAQSQIPSRSDPTIVNSYAAADTPTTGALAGGSVSGSGQITVGVTGGGTPIPTQSPFLGMNFIIATDGIYPSRP